MMSGSDTVLFSLYVCLLGVLSLRDVLSVYLPDQVHEQ